MCGIAGIHRFDGRPIDRAALVAMGDTLAHRGPDASGFWQSETVGFAHTRLSIIDLASSSQPLTSADERWVLCFNGEILNYRELRATLDYPFHTDGDTEVILAGIVQHGIGFVERLVGQFAFAIHDTQTGTTHLVRDRLGILPLNYTVSAEGLVFGSEIKAILAAIPTVPSVDLQSLDSYLSGRSVPSPNTLFAGISKLRPAHRAEVTRDGTIAITRYWQPPEEDLSGTWTPATAVEAVDAAITTAVDSALVADVPVGAYLSGGVDSSLIVAKIASR